MSKKIDLQYYRNAGVAPRKVEPQKSIIPDFVTNVASSIIAAPKTIPQKIKGAVADIKRGHALHKQGYGGYRESALSIAKKGKSEGRQRSAR